jgi:DNA-binding MarR family transcriptional regulator
MPNRELFLKTSVASQYVAQVVERHLEPVGVPGYLLALVTHVRDHAPVTPSGIAAASGIPLTTLRDNIQRLVDRGLARRIPNPDDARSYLLELTPAGEAMTRAADPALLEAYTAVESRLPRPRAEYERMLDELSEALRGTLDET